MRTYFPCIYMQHMYVHNLHTFLPDSLAVIEPASEWARYTSIRWIPFVAIFVRSLGSKNSIDCWTCSALSLSLSLPLFRRLLFLLFSLFLLLPCLPTYGLCRKPYFLSFLLYFICSSSRTHTNDNHLCLGNTHLCQLKIRLPSFASYICVCVCVSSENWNGQCTNRKISCLYRSCRQARYFFFPALNLLDGRPVKTGWGKGTLLYII